MLTVGWARVRERPPKKLRAYRWMFRDSQRYRCPERKRLWNLSRG